jgi:hypothetical protein
MKGNSSATSILLVYGMVPLRIHPAVILVIKGIGFNVLGLPPSFTGKLIIEQKRPGKLRGPHHNSLPSISRTVTPLKPDSTKASSLHDWISKSRG